MRAGTALGACLGREQERLVLWLPVAFGAGVLAYFDRPVEPPWVWPAAAFAVLVALAWTTRRRATLPLVALVLALAAAGWGWAQLATWSVAPRMLDRDVGAVNVSGRIVDIEPRDGGRVRVVVERPALSTPETDPLPPRVRISLRSPEAMPSPGATLSASAVLQPPPPPLAPGAYDFQRQSYFDGIGAVGFVLGRAAIDDAGAGSPDTLVERARRAISASIGGALDGPEAGLAKALVVGERGEIADDDRAALRDAGLAHLLAISGLHIGIVAGFVFWGVRALLALVPALALHHPVKKWAAIAGIAAAFVYMLIAGTTPPTARAFLMVALALGAVLLDRNPISMRLVATAALGVMLLAPAAVLGPSFQLSFAAVVALIAGFEWVEARRALIAGLGRPRGGGPRARPLVYLAATLYSTLVATLATAPFALFHFQQVALYGIVANLVAIPLMAFWIMPFLALGCLAAAVGLGELGFVPAGWGIALLRTVSTAIADAPGAVLRAPAAEAWTLALFAGGGLWLCLWRSRLRWLGAVPAVAGLVALLAAAPPAVFVAGSGRAYGLVAGSALYVPSLRRDRFDTEGWARLAGLDPAVSLRRLDAAADDGVPASCDAFGCVFAVAGRSVALAATRDALDDDCRLADLVVQLFPGGRACATGTPTIRYVDLAVDGAHSIALDGDGGLAVDSVGARRGHRPWVATNR
ncbi:MAG: ComEC/Rec2 family competence protein [Alphaproteobacteria bacterium]